MTQPRVLVAEDEYIVAYDLCDTIEEAGFTVEGPFADISSAMLALQKCRPDVAILDVELDDGYSFQLAEHLMAEDVPVIFHSSQFTPGEVAKRFPQAIACSKPCPPDKLLRKVHEVLAE